ncbi:hypothetical protein N7468_006968 [Penicillium chermesinum]|uniref:Ribosomal protein/NADH dehydrogenase domain-containing protein n=1 Tax=Penicillium chermesinum TaxID=63820 RepID=A0A9W9NVL3_9EURO|nr:uncharacterized protein N7468_006968 [Penicillium chermesinum]KAJ5225743.1 hypothetical protein N7468_006968 [Penicillium chermesinum]KAJ6161039.1 hypothetical protein N7470_004435 [Penicillium chermesinum]
MVNLFKRMRKLSTTLNVRTGLGAALFPTPKTATKEFPAVTRLHLTYAKRIEDGHRGARHFWRQCLPRLKYHNPGVGITVRQTDDQAGPAALTIYFSERLSSTAAAIAGANQVVDKHAPAPVEGEKAAVVNVKNLEFNEIWNRVQASTGAQELKPSAEDEAERKRLEAIAARAVGDRERIARIQQAKKDQERMLAEARGEVEKLKSM